MNNLEPAFKIISDDYNQYEVHVADHVWHKLFAGMAMNGILASDKWDKHAAVAEQSRETADAMLKELNGKEAECETDKQ